MKAIIIQGSSRRDGNTSKICDLFSINQSIDMLHLSDYQIGHFDYEFQNLEDDFHPLIQKLMHYPIWVFATPVYWYSMSGRTKVFLDRISDLLKIDKESGRKLRGKSLGLITCGSEAKLNKGFTIPFQLSAEYLGMDYLGDVHGWIENSEIPAQVMPEIEAYLQKILTILAS
ncbi:MAG: NAD(P)H-dependent oxidoreductase [Saprospiraceae bacterium]|nr:NAD(P)H-dependent oxidoreductase [Saprospiraceae bacterium]